MTVVCGLSATGEITITSIFNHIFSTGRKNLLFTIDEDNILSLRLSPLTSDMPMVDLRIVGIDNV